MLKQLTILLLVFVSLVSPSAAWGGCYSSSYYPSSYYAYPSYYPSYNYYYPVVEKKVVVIDYQPVYQVGYLPPSAVTTTTTQTVATQSVQAAAVQTQGVQTQGVGVSSCEQRLELLMQKFTALELKVTAMVGPPNAPLNTVPAPRETPKEAPKKTPEEPQAGLPKGSSIVKHCSSCHDVGSAQTKGGKLTLCEGGKVVRMDDKAIGAALRKMSEGTMPPPNDHKLSDSEFSDVINELIALNTKPK